MCATAAPTGSAALNVGVLPFTGCFNYPLSIQPRQLAIGPCQKNSQKVMKTTLCNVQLFEISVLSSLNLANMHMRLEEQLLFDEGEWFGSR